jgi:hypothetical protein
MVGRLKFVLPALVALALAGPMPVGATPYACFAIAGSGTCATDPLDVTVGDPLSIELILGPVDALGDPADPVDGYNLFTVDHLSFASSVLDLVNISFGSLVDGSLSSIFDESFFSLAIGEFVAGASGYGSILLFEFDVIGSGNTSLTFSPINPFGPVALLSFASNVDEAGAAETLSLAVNAQGSSSVPEPATFALIGLGLTVAALRLRSGRGGPAGS